MFKRINIEEQTPEWFEWRSTVCSASDAPAVMGKGMFQIKTQYDLYLRDTGQKEVFYSKAMSDGHKFEETALELARNTFGGKWEKALFEHDILHTKLDGGHTVLKFGASLDGWDMDHKYPVLEIKCVSSNSPTWNNDDILSNYKYQVQQQLTVTVSERALFFVYNKDTGEYKYKIVEHDSDLFLGILDAWTEYTNCIDNFKIPALTDKDKVERLDDEFCEKAARFKELKAQEKAIKKELDALKKDLIKLADGKPTKGAGVSVYPIAGRETIDYKSIPELQDIDLDQYKKQGKSSWGVR